MSRRRSSSMCCSRLMAPKLRPSFSVSGSTARLGIEVPWDVLDTVAQAAQSSANGIGVLGGRHDLTGLSADGLSVLLQFEFIDLIMNLALKFIAGALEFSHEFAHLARNLRQSLRPEQNQAQEHQKRYFRETEVHLESRAGLSRHTNDT